MTVLVGWPVLAAAFVITQLRAEEAGETGRPTKKTEVREPSGARLSHCAPRLR
jgi:hypothetical protein